MAWVQDNLLQVTSILPFFLVMGGLLAAGHLVLRSSPFYRRICIEERNRFETLDGIRGFLAFGVFFHHACVSYFTFADGKWKLPPSIFYAFAGPVPVFFFFVLTGFLFWGKAIAKGGKLNVKELYLSRFWRIAPLYLFSMAVMLVIAISQVGIWPRVPLGEYLYGLMRMGSVGIAGLKEFNGFDIGQIDAWVTWTLHYEWMFYLALPLLALLVRPRHFLILAAVVIGIHLWPARRPLIRLDWVMFVAGAAAAYIAPRETFRRILSGRWFSLLAIVLLVAIFVAGRGPKTFPNFLGVFAVFTILASGNSLFGLLTSPAAKFLGSISYSVYLLHGIVLFCALHAINRFTPVGAFSGPQYWLLVLGCALLTLLIASLTFRYIEHPCMHIGRKPREAQRPASEVVASR